MGVKDKLGKLVNIINTTNGSSSFLENNSQLDEIVWELLKEIDPNNLDYIKYMKTNINLEYQDFINIWYSFIKKNILEIDEDNVLNLNVEPDKSSLKISLFENELSILLEELYNLHIDCLEDDLLLFYFKDQSKLLLMYKSYMPLEESEEVRLPFWEYIIEHPNLKSKFENVFESDDNLCIMGYSI